MQRLLEQCLLWLRWIQQPQRVKIFHWSLSRVTAWGLICSLSLSLFVPTTLAENLESPPNIDCSVPVELQTAQKNPIFNVHFINDVREIFQFIRSVTEGHDEEAGKLDSFLHKANMYRHFVTTLRMYNHDLQGKQAAWKVYFQNYVFFASVSHGLETLVATIIAPILLALGHPVAATLVASLILPGPDVLCRAVDLASVLSVALPRMAYKMKDWRERAMASLPILEEELGFIRLDYDQTAVLLKASARKLRSRLMEFEKKENGNLYFTVKTPTGEPWVELVYQVSPRIQGYSLYSISFFRESLQKLMTQHQKATYKKLRKELSWLPWNSRDEVQYSLKHVLVQEVYRKDPFEIPLQFQSVEELERTIEALPPKQKNRVLLKKDDHKIELEIHLAGGQPLLSFTFTPLQGNSTSWILSELGATPPPTNLSQVSPQDLQEALEIPGALFEEENTGDAKDFRETLELFLMGKLQRYLPPYLQMSSPLLAQKDRITLYYKDGLIRLRQGRTFKHFTRVKRFWQHCRSYLSEVPWDKLPYP